jgi:hypothetical protein
MTQEQQSDQIAQTCDTSVEGPKYILEGSPTEAQRLQLQHEIIKDAMGDKLVAAPLDLSKPGLRILDSATADGKSYPLLKLVSYVRPTLTFTLRSLAPRPFPRPWPW